MEPKRYTIEELSERTGFPRRTIRYYIQEGILEPPAGRGRGGFYYDSHLKRLLEIRALQDRGVRLAAIRQVLGGRAETEPPRVPAPPSPARPEPASREAPERSVWTRFCVAPGVEIHVAREVEEARKRKVLEMVRVARSILERQEEGGSHEEDG